ncbi:MAG TPA: DUF421 domain-containing protein [Firmicutes bacterium]|jgi:uncharacterized membrane protein YcaP (DUF421 family)|nr:DUF421 domain-containing protein [Bacillota bacterium]
MTLLKAFFEGSKDLPFWALAIRSVILYIALIMATRAMGHRQIGILTGHNYLVAAGIVSLAAIRMVNPESSFTSALVIVFVYAGVNVFLSYLDIKFPKLVDRKPVILMKGGRLDKKRLLDCHVTLDNLLGQIRLKGAHNLSEIDSLVLEPTGKISVIKKPASMPVTRKEMNLPQKGVGLPTILVYDGEVQKDNLAGLGLDLKWLKDRLGREGCARPDQVFLAMIEPDGKLFVSV